MIWSPELSHGLFKLRGPDHISATLDAEGDLSKAELKQLVAAAVANDRARDVVLTMANVVADRAHRREGIENDLARFAAIESLELEKINAPTLIISGTADIDVSPDHSTHAAETIPGAERLVLDRGTHLCLFVHPDANAAQARVIAKLRANT
jgi:pimeloyl-ACP methyl ester carboxylesterase